jgi:hypothetical protein
MGIHCDRTACICTHTDGCEAGWIWLVYWVDARGQRCSEFDNIEKRKYEGVVPCRNCDHERWVIWNSTTSSKEYGERLRARSQSNRTKAYENEERSKTRTL